MDRWKEKALQCLRLPFIMVCWVASVMIVFKEDSTTRTVWAVVAIAVLWLWWSLGDGKHVKNFFTSRAIAARENFYYHYHEQKRYMITRQRVIDALEMLLQLPVPQKNGPDAPLTWKCGKASLLVACKTQEEYVCVILSELQSNPDKIVTGIQGYCRLVLPLRGDNTRVNFGLGSVDLRSHATIRVMDLPPAEEQHNTLQWIELSGPCSVDKAQAIMYALENVLESVKMIGDTPAR